VATREQAIKEAAEAFSYWRTVDDEAEQEAA
jgi:hypothetical protein